MNSHCPKMADHTGVNTNKPTPGAHPTTTPTLIQTTRHHHQLGKTSCSPHIKQPHEVQTTTDSCHHKSPTQQANKNKAHARHISYPHPNPTITKQFHPNPPNPSFPHPSTRTTKTHPSQHKTEPNYHIPSGMVPTYLPLPRGKSTTRQRHPHLPHPDIHAILHRQTINTRGTRPPVFPLPPRRGRLGRPKPHTMQTLP